MEKRLKHKETIKNPHLSEQATTLPQFINILKDDLLSSIMQETDPVKRKSLGKKMSQCLDQLQAMLSSRLLVTEQMRRDIFKVLTTGEKHENSTSVFKGNLLTKSGPQLWLEHEENMDKQLCRVTEEKIHNLQGDNQMLQETLDRREDIRAEVARTFKRSDSKAKLVTNPDERIEMLEALMKKHDDELLTLSKEITATNRQYVHVSKPEYEEMMLELEPCVKKCSDLSEVQKAKGILKRQELQQNFFTVSDSLTENVWTLTRYVERMRRRVGETGESKMDWEKDKILCLQLLKKKEDVDVDVQVNDVMLRKLKKWERREHDYRKQTENMYKEKSDLEEQNRTLLKEYHSIMLEQKRSEKAKPVPKKLTPKPTKPKAKPEKEETRKHHSPDVTNFSTQLITLDTSRNKPRTGRAVRK